MRSVKNVAWCSTGEKWKSLSRVQLFGTPWTIHSLWNSPSQNTGVGRLSLLQGIFPTQVSALQADSLPAEPQGKPKNTGVGRLSLLQQILPTQESNRGLLHCRRILYQLSYCLINIDCPNSQGCWENGGRQRRLLCKQTQCDQHVDSPAELRTEDPAERAGRHLGKGERHMQGLVGGPAVSSSRSGEASRDPGGGRGRDFQICSQAGKFHEVKVLSLLFKQGRVRTGFSLGNCLWRPRGRWMARRGWKSLYHWRSYRGPKGGDGGLN